MSDQDEAVRGINTNLSYFTLRKVIGWSGLLLPWLAWIVAWSYQSSISDYYYTRSGELPTDNRQTSTSNHCALSPLGLRVA